MGYILTVLSFVLSESQTLTAQRLAFSFPFTDLQQSYETLQQPKVKTIMVVVQMIRVGQTRRSHDCFCR